MVIANSRLQPGREFHSGGKHRCGDRAARTREGARCCIRWGEYLKIGGVVTAIQIPLVIGWMMLYGRSDWFGPTLRGW